MGSVLLHVLQNTMARMVNYIHLNMYIWILFITFANAKRGTISLGRYIGGTLNLKSIHTGFRMLCVKNIKSPMNKLKRIECSNKLGLTTSFKLPQSLSVTISALLYATYFPALEMSCYFELN